jgi:hypothetical protein
MAEAGDLPEDFHLQLSLSGQLAWLYHKCVSDTLMRHDLFCTKQKYFGLAPPGTRSGDIIAVCSGARTPFVIQQLKGISQPKESCCILAHPREEETVSYFALLGPCYLEGIMHGEIYGDMYEYKFDWKVEPFPMGRAFRLATQAIRFLQILLYRQ